MNHTLHLEDIDGDTAEFMFNDTGNVEIAISCEDDEVLFLVDTGDIPSLAACLAKHMRENLNLEEQV